LTLRTPALVESSGASNADTPIRFIGDDVAAEGEAGSPGSGGASPTYAAVSAPTCPSPKRPLFTDTDTDTDCEKIYKTFLILG